MRIQMIHGVLGTDGATWDAGTVHDAPDWFGRWLLERKKARRAPEQAPAPESAAEPAEPVAAPAAPPAKRPRRASK
ncbi:MAG TPA: hypothetical protein VF167_02920 [Longimicrobiaceae bacterium]